MSAFTLNTLKFEKQMNELARISRRTDKEIVTLNAVQILRSIAYNSPKRSGTMNKGWLPAWNALGAAGTPNTRARRKPEAGQTASGGFIDGRNESKAFFEFQNDTHTLRRGKRINYPYIVNARVKFMEKAEREIAVKFDQMIRRKYSKLMRGYD